MAGLRYAVERKYVIRDQVSYRELETIFHNEQEANATALRMNEAYAVGTNDQGKIRQELEAKIREEMEKEYEDKLKKECENRAEIDTKNLRKDI